MKIFKTEHIVPFVHEKEITDRDIDSLMRKMEADGYHFLSVVACPTSYNLTTLYYTFCKEEE